MIPDDWHGDVNELCIMAHNIACEKGWYNQPRYVPELLCLIHSELSEALEEFRDGHHLVDIRHDENGKPLGFAIEVADAFIRLADMCGFFDIDIWSAIQEKMIYNRTRPHRHGGKLA